MIKKTTKGKKVTKEDLLKLEVAQELGLLDKINSGGWGALTAKEAGKIGGIITSRIKKGIYADYNTSKR